MVKPKKGTTMETTGRSLDKPPNPKPRKPRASHPKPHNLDRGYLGIIEGSSIVSLGSIFCVHLKPNRISKAWFLLWLTGVKGLGFRGLGFRV